MNHGLPIIILFFSWVVISDSSQSRILLCYTFSDFETIWMVHYVVPHIHEASLIHSWVLDGRGYVAVLAIIAHGSAVRRLQIMAARIPSLDHVCAKLLQTLRVLRLNNSIALWNWNSLNNLLELAGPRLSSIVAWSAERWLFAPIGRCCQLLDIFLIVRPFALVVRWKRAVCELVDVLLIRQHAVSVRRLFNRCKSVG